MSANSSNLITGLGGGDLLEKLKEQKKTGPLWSSSVASPVNPCLFRPLVGWGLIHYRDTSRWDTQSQRGCVYVSFFFFNHSWIFLYITVFTSFSYPTSPSAFNYQWLLALRYNAFRTEAGNACSTQDESHCSGQGRPISGEFGGQDREIPAGFFYSTWITGPTGVRNLSTKLLFSFGHVLLSLLTMRIKASL